MVSLSTIIDDGSKAAEAMNRALNWDEIKARIFEIGSRIN